MTKPFSRVRAAAIDGRLANVYKRQTELEQLHETLSQNSKDITNAMVQDSGNSPAEAAVEYHLSLASLKQQYTLLNPIKEHEDEYRIAHGADAPDRREPAGLVYIAPTSHTLLFSVIAPLSAAIAAGNCAIVELRNDLRTLPALLRKLLRAALDTDIIDISSSRPDDTDLLAHCTEVLQTGAEPPYKLNQIISPAQERVIAVVDRTADLWEAAQAVVTARFSFGGRSPYAPDVVLVNEFIKKDFLEAVVRQSIGFLAGSNEFVGEKKSSLGTGTNGSLALIDGLKREGGARVITSGSNGTILDVDRSSVILHRKVTGCCLCVHAVSSLDDAIDLANRDNTLLATYTFANLPSAKYLSQFINARVAFVNHIPTELLVGPASPLNHTVTPGLRYPSVLFNSPRPQYVKASPESALLAHILRSDTTKNMLQLSAVLKTEDLGAKRRPIGGAVGFFEQGILTGLAIVLTPVLAGAGMLGWYGVKTIVSRWR